MANRDPLTFTEPAEVDLAKLPTEAPGGATKHAAREEIAGLSERLEGLFDLLNFAGQNGLLLVIQGMDAAGKDGAIRHVLSHCHAQSARVASFKVPSEEEARHDFLWRVHWQVPARGEIVLFNRSHYEDVGVVRVHDLITKDEAERRIEGIRAFEELLANSGTIVRKVWLHVSKEEQEERLREREADPRAYWKLSVGDWKERAYWDDYMKVYGHAIGATAAKDAPWTVIPCNRKWWRDLVLTNLLIAAMEPYEEAWKSHLEEVGAEMRKELTQYRA